MAEISKNENEGIAGKMRGPDCPVNGFSSEETQSSSSLPSLSTQSSEMAYSAPKSRLHYIPLLLLFYFPLALGACYAEALKQGHIYPYFAFISDVGALQPEHEHFAEFLNIGALLFASFVFIRYMQVKHFVQERFKRATQIRNIIVLCLGLISSLGMGFVGGFSELKDTKAHLVGAGLAFVVGSIYIIFQGHFTLNMLPYFQSKAMAYLRIIFGVLGLMLYFGAQAAILFAYKQSDTKSLLDDSPESLKWEPTDVGYQLRAASVVMEWLCAVVLIAFLVTFVPEFKKFTMGRRFQVKLLIDEDDKVDNQYGETLYDNAQVPMERPSDVIISDGQTSDIIPKSNNSNDDDKGNNTGSNNIDDDNCKNDDDDITYNINQQRFYTNDTIITIHP